MKSHPSAVTPRPHRDSLQYLVQEQVKRYIIQNALRPGDSLPPEAELARQLQVSRPSLREAMRVLQTIGVIESRHGAGTFVGRFRLNALVDGLSFAIQVSEPQDARQMIHDLLDLREALEIARMREIVPNLRDDTIDELNRIAERMAANIAADREIDNEQHAFRAALASGSPNALTATLTDALAAANQEIAPLYPALLLPASQRTAIYHELTRALTERNIDWAIVVITDAFASLRAAFDAIPNQGHETTHHPLP